MDDLRKQLELLMESVGGSLEGGNRKLSFTDQEICRYFLTGLCPHDLFKNTKQHLGDCEKKHSEEAKEEYELSRKDEYYRYEEEALKFVRNLVDDCDRKIDKLRVRCINDDQFSEGLLASTKKKMEECDAELSAQIQKVEELAEKGSVDESMKAMDEVKSLEIKKKSLELELQRKESGAPGSWVQKLEPCGVCAALLSSKDDEARRQEHLTGRVHIGYGHLREHIKVLEQYIKENSDKPHHNERERDRNRERGSTREKVKDRERKERGRERERTSSSKNDEHTSSRTKRYREDEKSDGHRHSRHGREHAHRSGRHSSPSESKYQRREKPEKRKKAINALSF